jgi:hypothetical protein
MLVGLGLGRTTPKRKTDPRWVRLHASERVAQLRWSRTTGFLAGGGGGGVFVR